MFISPVSSVNRFQRQAALATRNPMRFSAEKPDEDKDKSIRHRKRFISIEGLALHQLNNVPPSIAQYVFQGRRLSLHPNVWRTIKGTPPVVHGTSDLNKAQKKLFDDSIISSWVAYTAHSLVPYYLLQKGNLTGALQSFANAIEHDPYPSDSYYALGKFAQALLTYQRELKALEAQAQMLLGSPQKPDRPATAFEENLAKYNHLPIVQGLRYPVFLGEQPPKASNAFILLFPGMFLEPGKITPPEESLEIPSEKTQMIYQELKKPINWHDLRAALLESDIPFERIATEAFRQAVRLEPYSEAFDTGYNTVLSNTPEMRVDSLLRLAEITGGVSEVIFKDLRETASSGIGKGPRRFTKWRAQAHLANRQGDRKQALKYYRQLISDPNFLKTETVQYDLANFLLLCSPNNKFGSISDTQASVALSTLDKIMPIKAESDLTSELPPKSEIFYWVMTDIYGLTGEQDKQKLALKQAQLLMNRALERYGNGPRIKGLKERVTTWINQVLLSNPEDTPDINGSKIRFIAKVTPEGFEMSSFLA